MNKDGVGAAESECERELVGECDSDDDGVVVVVPVAVGVGVRELDVHDDAVTDELLVWLAESEPDFKGDAELLADAPADMLATLAVAESEFVVEAEIDGQLDEDTDSVLIASVLEGVPIEGVVCADAVSVAELVDVVDNVSVLVESGEAVVVAVNVSVILGSGDAVVVVDSVSVLDESGDDVVVGLVLRVRLPDRD